MQDFFIQVLLPILGTALSALATWAMGLLIAWLNSKIKDQKLNKYVTTITELVFKAVQEVNQTYVSEIKKQGKWTKETSEIAFNKCMEIIKKECAPEILDYVGHNFGDVTDYLKTLIESTIAGLKQQ